MSILGLKLNTDEDWSQPFADERTLKQASKFNWEKSANAHFIDYQVWL